MPRAIWDVWVIRRLSSHGCLKNQNSGFHPDQKCPKIGAAVIAGRSLIREIVQQDSVDRRDDAILFARIEPFYMGRANRLFTLVQVRSIAPYWAVSTRRLQLASGRRMPMHHVAPIEPGDFTVLHDPATANHDPVGAMSAA